MSFSAKFRRFLICFVVTECAVMIAWLLVAQALGDPMSLESFLALTGITSIFVACGGLLIGVPVAILVRRRGWGASGLQFKVIGGVTGGLAAYGLTLLAFIDGPDVGFPMARITVWFGAIAGLVAAWCWQRLASPEAKHQL